MKDKTLPGTKIQESQMEKMLRHNREITGQTPPSQQPVAVDHQKISEGLLASQPVLMPSLAGPRPRLAASRIVEGVAGTSPTPGQDDNLGFIPPTTSNTADPANIPAKGPDAENQPASKTRAERMQRDLQSLYAEDQIPNFDKEDEGDGEGKDDGDEDDKDKKDKDDKDDKDKDDKDGKTDDGDEGVEESVEVHCESCGYEETYSLSETNINEGNVPLTAEGKLDNKCPMCGADMDLSMVGATNVGEIGDPSPRTDARGNDGSQKESVSPDAINYASQLMRRVVEGEDVDAVAKSVIEGDFMPRVA